MPEENPGPYAPPSSKNEGQASSPPSRSRRKAGCILSLTLLILSGLVFYYAMFWGWASSAGSPPNAEQLKASSNLAAGVSGTLFLAALLVAFRSR